MPFAFIKDAHPLPYTPTTISLNLSCAAAENHQALQKKIEKKSGRCRGLMSARAEPGTASATGPSEDPSSKRCSGIQFLLLCFHLIFLQTQHFYYKKFTIQIGQRGAQSSHPNEQGMAREAPRGRPQGRGGHVLESQLRGLQPISLFLLIVIYSFTIRE